MPILFGLVGLLLPFAELRLPHSQLPILAALWSLAILFLLPVDYQKIRLPREAWFGFLCLLLGSMIGALLAGGSQHSLGVLLLWILLPAIVALLVCVADKPSQNGLQDGLVIAIVLLLVLQILQMLGHGILFPWQNAADLVQYLTTDRFPGPFDSPNTLAMFVLPVGFFAMSQVKNGQWLWPISVCSMLVLLASRSRGGLLAAAIAISMVYTARWLPRRRRWLSLFGLLLMPLAIWLDPANRLDIWRGSLATLHGHWLLGLGSGQFQVHFAAATFSWANFAAFITPYAIHPHNFILATVSEAGAFGLAGFVLLFAAAIWRQLSRPEINIWLLAALLAILLHGMVDTPFWQASLAPLTWLILVFALVERKSDETARH